MNWKTFFITTSFFLSSSALAVNWIGTGNNFGSGWKPDGLGGLSGTGNNFGSGWKTDGLGGLRGTGNNFGSGWKPDGLGGFRGTGNNFGSGWKNWLCFQRNFF